MEAFAIAYDQTFCSQTDGKINVNLNITPTFNGKTLTRHKPIEALLQPNTYTAAAAIQSADYLPLDAGRLQVAQISTDIASCSGITSGPCGGLPSDMLIYPGQLCQVNSMSNSGTTQWQRESLMRNIVGAVTTQCSDYKVFVVAQSIKQVAFTGNPVIDLMATGEQRMSAVISRENNFGPDNLPDTGIGAGTSSLFGFASGTPDEPPTSYLSTPASSTSGIVTPYTSLNVTMPPFKYVISQVNYNNN